MSLKISLVDVERTQIILAVTLLLLKFQYSTISENDIDSLQRQYEELLAKIRPNAVGLVDAFDLRDEVGLFVHMWSSSAIKSTESN